MRAVREKRRDRDTVGDKKGQRRPIPKWVTRPSTEAERVRVGSTTRDELPTFIGLRLFADSGLMNEIGFEESGNPVFAWQEYARCRRNRDKVPSWLLRYLGSCAERIEGLLESPPNADIAKAITEAMGFTNRRARANALGESYRAYQQRVLLAMTVDGLIHTNGLKPTRAYIEAARICGVSASSAKQAYLLLQPRLRPMKSAE